MELLFESRLNVSPVSGKLLWTQAKARLHPEPVIARDTSWDGAGASPMTVLHDGGRYRMWYSGWPADWGGSDACHACYAESDNGIDWVKPKLNVVKDGAGPSHRLNLPMCSVFIDPDAPASHRYRGLTSINPWAWFGPLPVREPGYCTAHSADGLAWELDADRARWAGADVISGVYHPGRRCGLAAFKYNPRYHVIPRRAVWLAELRDGVWGDGARALVPDDFDDVAAMTRGYCSGDYYGLTLLPAGGASCAGILQQFRHSLPRTAGVGCCGVFGVTDLSLVYQDGPRDCWQHAPGRQDFLGHEGAPWTKGGIYSAGNVLTRGQEQRLYLTGQGQTHAWYLDESWKLLPRWKEAMRVSGDVSRGGFASWPAWRLFGYRADPEGVLSIRLGAPAQPVEVVLNCEAEPGGSIRAELEGDPERGIEAAVPLAGDQPAATVRWQNGTSLPPRADGTELNLKLHLERATVWAYEVRPLS